MNFTCALFRPSKDHSLLPHCVFDSISILISDCQNYARVSDCNLDGFSVKKVACGATRQGVIFLDA